MFARKHSSARGQSRQEVALILGLGAILYYGYQYFTIYQAPKQLVNKDFICGEGAFKQGRQTSHSYCVYGSQNPKALIDWAHVSNISARLQAPDKAIANENARYKMINSHELVDLSDLAYGDKMSDMYNPLVVHVVDTDNRAKDVPLLIVRPMNKKFKGQTWYIAATSINPVANVTGFAGVAAKTHKVGMLDVLETQEGQKIGHSLLNALTK